MAELANEGVFNEENNSVTAKFVSSLNSVKDTFANIAANKTHIENYMIISDAVANEKNPGGEVWCTADGVTWEAITKNGFNIPKEPAQKISAILSYIEKHKKAFAVLYADTSSGQIREELRRCYKEYLPPCLSEIFNGKWFTTQNVALASVSGLLEIIECWLRSDCAESVGSITGLIMRAHKCLYAEFANG